MDLDIKSCVARLTYYVGHSMCDESVAKHFELRPTTAKFQTQTTPRYNIIFCTHTYLLNMIYVVCE